MVMRVRSTRLVRNAWNGPKGPAERLIVRVGYPQSRSKYRPHQGERECARRVRQAGNIQTAA